MNFRLFAIQLIRMQAEVHNFLAPLSLWWFSKYVTMSPLSPDSETAEAAEGGGGRRPIHEEEEKQVSLESAYPSSHPPPIVSPQYTHAPTGRPVDESPVECFE